MPEPKRSSREMELEDALSDPFNGFRIWRDGKCGSGEWTDKDEAFSRWVEGGPAWEFA